MISGTAFMIEEPEFVTHACARVPAAVASRTEIEEIRAQCEVEQAMCLACEDGMVVVDLRPGTEGLEMFIWIGVAFRHGAFGRQDAALRAIGRDLGAASIAFQARRRGWARRLGPEWYRRGSNEFVRSI
jgi:hypothetical protein